MNSKVYYSNLIVDTTNDRNQVHGCKYIKDSFDYSEIFAIDQETALQQNQVRYLR